MKMGFTVLAAASVLVIATASWAEVMPGTYGSTDVGGKVLVPRASQSEDLLVPKPGIGDIFNLASWDGGKLGTQWSIMCSTQPGPKTVKGDLDDKGNGTIETHNYFTGGSFFLARQGPWGGEINSLGTITEVRLRVVESYLGFWLVKMNVSMEALGRIGIAGKIVRFTTTDCSTWGETDSQAPSGYPSMLDYVCEPTRTTGYWWELGNVTVEIRDPFKGRLQIDPAAANRDAVAAPQNTSWGRVKQIYR